MSHKFWKNPQLSLRLGKWVDIFDVFSHSWIHCWSAALPRFRHDYRWTRLLHDKHTSVPQIPLKTYCGFETDPSCVVLHLRGGGGQTDWGLLQGRESQITARLCSGGVASRPACLPACCISSRADPPSPDGSYPDVPPALNQALRDKTCLLWLIDGSR